MAPDGSKGLKGVVAGAITGGLEILVTYPTEFVKTQLQLDEKGDSRKFKGTLDCIRKTVNTNGVFGLYRGLSVLLLGSIPKSAARFGSFEYFSHKFQGYKANNQRFMAGLMAGLAEAVLVVTPMETIKVKIINDNQSPNPKYRGLFHGVTEIVKAEGIGGIYKGFLPTMIKQGSSQAIRFCVLFALKDMYTGHDPNESVPKLAVGIFGAIAGAASVFFNNPVDVVKTRMQGLEAHKYKNSADCFLQTLRSEGPKAFYKGTLPRLGRVCTGVALTFMIYDSIMEIINAVWKENKINP
ncbi:tricarboxylate transport protein, mitochondrial-like [Drosophila tropicalis]|uniref:tricarboxylate transport protein, mitochondrial-like n=1 Tax=Drosophila tropicalis TaxID=46794 RepID=UPI0035AC1D8D